MTPIEISQAIGYGLIGAAVTPVVYRLVGFRSIVSIVTIGIVGAGFALFLMALFG